MSLRTVYLGRHAAKHEPASVGRRISEKHKRQRGDKTHTSAAFVAPTNRERPLYAFEEEGPKALPWRGRRQRVISVVLAWSQVRLGVVWHSLCANPPSSAFQGVPLGWQKMAEKCEVLVKDLRHLAQIGYWMALRHCVTVWCHGLAASKLGCPHA